MQTNGSSTVSVRCLKNTKIKTRNALVYLMAQEEDEKTKTKSERPSVPLPCFFFFFPFCLNLNNFNRLETARATWTDDFGLLLVLLLLLLLPNWPPLPPRVIHRPLFLIIKQEEEEESTNRIGKMLQVLLFQWRRTGRPHVFLYSFSISQKMLDQFSSVQFFLLLLLFTSSLWAWTNWIFYIKK